MEQARRPEVVLVRSSAPVPAAPTPAASRRWGPLLLAGCALLLAGTAGPDRPPVEEVDAQLVAQPQDLSVSQGGVLVLPLELRNGGSSRLAVSAQAYAEPVVEDPVAQAPVTVEGRDARRFVALVAPDCRLLRPGSPLEFRATVQLRVVAQRGARDLVVDVGAVPAVRDVVRGLCG